MEPIVSDSEAVGIICFPGRGQLSQITSAIAEAGTSFDLHQ